MRYCVTADVPLELGAIQLKDACALPPDATALVGLLGAPVRLMGAVFDWLDRGP
jgi:hypothetical protein